MAELTAFAEQAPSAGGILHLGATSTDIEDNAEAIRIRESLRLVLEQLQRLLTQFATQIDRWADLPILAFTHIQPAEPSTLGYRLAFYAQDLLADWEALSSLTIRGKGFKGAVGTAASYAQLIGIENLPDFEQKLSRALDLPFYPVTNQVYPRKQDYQVLTSLAGLGASLHKFAFDLRLLQSPVIGELSEPFGKHQVGSSAMPFKRNPIQAEKIDSLARWLAQAPRTAWDNAALSLLERTLDDSANRRILLPEAFLIADELLNVTDRLVANLQVNQVAIEKNLKTYAPFAAIEPVLMDLAKSGADRQKMHARLREHALKAWDIVQRGEENPLAVLVANDQLLLGFIHPDRIREIFASDAHVGFAPDRAREMAQTILQAVNPGPPTHS
jgi:adenylosuccinate lyase